MKNKISAVYPGSFDPLTNGHLDIIKRASLMFSDITIAVTKNLNKNHLFSLSERMDMISEASKDIKNVKVITFEGLLADYLKKINSFVLIRGLRAVSDFEYEFQMALMNRKINKKIETVFLMPDIDYTFLSSSMIREIAMLGGNTEIFVPPFVEKKLRELKKSITVNK